VKLVNPADAAAPVHIAVNGLSTLAPTATALTLAADPNATNSIAGPESVVPVTTKVAGVKPSFSYTVPAHGIVTLILETR
jgi:alpha-L-arabinofuranosidase